MDEVVDIRYFNNETQKSIEKIKFVEIQPVYKFVLNENSPKLDPEDDGYFEGIEVYQSYFSDNLVSVLDYFKDYTIIFDDSSEIYSKYEFVAENFEKQLEENLKLELLKPLKSKNHFTFEDFLRKTSYFYSKIFQFIP